MLSSVYLIVFLAGCLFSLVYPYQWRYWGITPFFTVVMYTWVFHMLFFYPLDPDFLTEGFECLFFAGWMLASWADFCGMKHLC